MPLRSGGALDNESMRGRASQGLINVGKGEVTLFSDTFDPHGDLSKWDVIQQVALGNMSVQSVIKHSGAYAARVESIPHDGFDYISKTLPDLSPYSSIRHVMWIYLDSLPFAVDEGHAFVAQADEFLNLTAGIYVVRRNSDYKWFFLADTFELDSDIIPFATWVKAEMRTYIGDFEHGYVEFLLDDVLKTTSSFLDTTLIRNVAFGNFTGFGYGSTFNPLIAYGDDCKVIGVP
jgi:hypothetical protein